MLLAEYLVRRINFDWWSKYNFVLSAAMDAGTIVCGILIFLTLQLPRNGTICECDGAFLFGRHRFTEIGIIVRQPSTGGGTRCLPRH